METQELRQVWSGMKKEETFAEQQNVLVSEVLCELGVIHAAIRKTGFCPLKPKEND